MDSDSGIDRDSKDDNDNDDVSFDSSDDEAIIYRMKLVERRRKRKSKSIIIKRGINDKKKKVNHQLNPHNHNHPLTEQDDGIVEHKNKISTIVAVETNITVDEAAKKFDGNNNNFSNSISSLKKRKRITLVWMEMYQRLITYKKEHDNSTKVPINYEKDPKLGWWAASQRKSNNNKSLSHDRHSLLDLIEFNWGNCTGPRGKNTDWMDMYEQLLVFKKQHHHFNIPQKTKLRTWVNSQRKSNSNKNLLHDRRSLLNSINFVWVTEKRPQQNTSWMETYQRLVAYKKQHNNTNVPARYKEDPKLSLWVSKQRSNYRIKTIKEERCQLLNSIGFQWSLRVRVRSLSSSATSSKTAVVAAGTCKNTITTGRINDSKTIDDDAPPPTINTGCVVRTHHHQSCVPDETTNNATVSSSRSFSPSRRLPILGDSGNIHSYDDDEGDIIII